MQGAPQKTLRVAREAIRRAFLADLVSLGGVAMLLGALAAAVLVAIDRLLIGIGTLPALVAAPLVIAAFAAMFLAVSRRWTPLHAAVELDHRLGLKDTLASALALHSARPSQHQAFATWAIEDAERAAATVKVRRHIPVQPRWHWTAWPVVIAAAIAAGLYLPALNWLRAEPQTAVAPSIQAAREQVQIAQAAARSIVEEAQADAATTRELEMLEQLQRELEAGRADPAQAAARASRQLRELGESLESRARTEQATRDLMRDRLTAAREAAASRHGALTSQETEALAAMAEAISRGDFETAAEIASRTFDGQQTLGAEERRRAAEDLEELANLMRDAAQERTGDPIPPEPSPGEPQPGETEPSPPQPARPPQSQDPRTDPREIERDLRQQGMDAESAKRQAERMAEENRQRQAEDRARERMKELEQSMRDAARDLRQEQPPADQPQRGTEPRPGAQGQQPEQREGQQQQQRPEQQQQPSQQPGQQPDQKPGQQPGQQPGAQPGEEPAQQPGTEPGQQPQPSPQPGAQPTPQPGMQPQPTPQPGQPDSPETQPAPDAGAQPDTQPGATPSPPPGMEQAPQPGEGQEPTPDQQSGRGIERLRKALEKMAQDGRQAERMQQQSQQIQDMAERMLRDMSPEEREELRRMAEQMQRQGTPQMPPPRQVTRPDGQEDPLGLGHGGPGREPQSPMAQQPTTPHLGDVDPVDARPPEQRPSTPQQRERVLAEWFGEGISPSDEGRIPFEAIRQAAQSAERAVEQQAVPPRYSDLVRRVFRRYAQQGENP